MTHDKDCVHYPDCAADCELLAEMERERNNWVLAYEITAAGIDLPARLVDPQGHKGSRTAEEWIIPCMAAAYAIAEAYGEGWQEWVG